MQVMNRRGNKLAAEKKADPIVQARGHEKIVNRTQGVHVKLQRRFGVIGGVLTGSKKAP